MLRDMDAQFSLDSVSNLETVFEQRQAAADAALARFAVHRKLPYGDGPGRTLNIFPAEGADDPAPVQFFIHGGFWRSLDADLFSFLARGFVPFGAMLVVIDYPLMPQTRLSELVEACRQALVWTHANCANYGGDPSRIFISGNSAGGHLVAELADRPLLLRSGLAEDAIKGVTAVSGIYDIEPVTRSFQDDFLSLTPEEVSAFSPLRRPYDLAAPMIVTLGGDETEEFHRQSELFARHCHQEKYPVSLEIAPRTNHITVLTEALAEPENELNRSVRRQMGLLA
ncbi:alpha/beta hydrolase (plasmid) [Neorhizobium sp. SOG26]|jgi:Esterase/lipase|uniref:Alpha/beta hydrolase n=2 Tax=Neorhizobium TaxID=1525371 RepID=A0ABT0IN23_9HYPH|nr:alpha/beta hydrolase [Neorhizobium turbinariae]AXV17917.1 alpha/beta hydrolase [Neorhizobium sp. SOG26]MCK8779248.1 alpha/beta hydrolase [Neorhizobium turbinariae]